MLVLFIETSSFASSFYLHFCDSTNLEELDTTVVLSAVFMWEHPYIDYVSLISLSQELSLLWMPVTSLPRVCWPLSP